MNRESDFPPEDAAKPRNAHDELSGLIPPGAESRVLERPEGGSIHVKPVTDEKGGRLGIAVHFYDQAVNQTIDPEGEKKLADPRESYWIDPMGLLQQGRAPERKPSLTGAAYPTVEPPMLQGDQEAMELDRRTRAERVSSFVMGYVPKEQST